MEDKRTFLAIGLCLLVLIGWNFFSDMMGWTPRPPEVAQQAASPSKEADVAPKVPSEPLPPVPAFTPAEGREITVDTPLFTAVFHTGGGVLRSFYLKNFAENLSSDSPRVNLVTPSAAGTSPLGLVVNGQPSWSTGRWSYSGTDVRVEPGKNAQLVFTGEVDGILVRRIMTIHSDSYLIEESTVARPMTGAPRSMRLGMTVGATNFGESSSYDPTRLGWSDDGSYKHDSDKDDLIKKGIQKSGRFLWAGVMSNYFMTMIVPLDASADMTIKGRVQNDVWRIGLERPTFALSPETETTVRTAWWLGPKDRVALAKAPNDLQSTVDFGMFSFIAKPLLAILEFFHSYVGNWGIAILLLTLCIRLLFWPLAQKSYKSMEQMKLVQPMMQRIKEKYKDDREAMNREMMQLYRTYKINPASGCLPLLVQIPVFIGLYQALLNAIQLRHASFITYLPFTDKLWLADLSAKDPYYITPLLMGLTMFIQQKMSPSTGDPTQQKVMMFLPAIFTIMFLGFPAGLVVYWLANNILSIGQQWWMLRRVKAPVLVKRG